MWLRHQAEMVSYAITHVKVRAYHRFLEHPEALYALFVSDIHSIYTVHTVFRLCNDMIFEYMLMTAAPCTPPDS